MVASCESWSSPPTCISGEAGTDMNAIITKIRAELNQYSDPAKARDLLWFFQARPGGYGAGDRFRGVRVPVIRRLAAKYRGLALEDAHELLASPIHEERMLSLCILVSGYDKGDER